MWKHRGQRRPDFAETPGPEQESVWDYPRPPELDRVQGLVEVFDGDTLLGRSQEALRVLETASPPTVYLPPMAVERDRLVSVRQASFCEWKGAASYWALARSPEQAVGWSYPEPSPRFLDIAGWFSFYPSRVRCFLDGERVRPQGGGFYGGWVTDRIAGPWKGDAGTGGW
ncbi:MAG: DUF427 domain-containing protein [Xanthomonadales bacterium]|jgi:uncharacterized protein (DUF427 family)|nr:DUF427 domain-containing protein [Xanthomonadales bacterium]